MLAILTLFVVLVVSLLLTRVAAIALVTTGLSREAARFQARSAFTGVGFTTTESEKVVGHPVRRRILMLVMLLGNAGFVTAVSTLVIGFVGGGGEGGGGSNDGVKLAVLIACIVALWQLASSARVDRFLSTRIEALLRRTTDLDVRDYASLLQLSEGYSVHELSVRDGGWLADRELGTLGLREEGVVVLGIERDDEYFGVPDADSKLLPGDTVLVYGHEDSLARIDERRRGFTGDAEHRRATAEQERSRQEEKQRERRSEEAQEEDGGSDDR